MKYIEMHPGKKERKEGSRGMETKLLLSFIQSYILHTYIFKFLSFPPSRKKQTPHYNQSLANIDGQKKQKKTLNLCTQFSSGQEKTTGLNLNQHEMIV